MTHSIDGVLIKGVGGNYRVSARGDVYTCTVRGIFRNRGVTPLVGDRVTVQVTDQYEKKGTVTHIKPRSNELSRPRAANIDQVIVTMAAAQPAFTPGLLDRYLVLAGHAGMPEVAICLNKIDLADGCTSNLLAPYRMAGYAACETSVATGVGLGELRSLMQGKLSLFAGPSGAGKTSLINCLCPRAVGETGDVSGKNNKGRHTTRHTEIVPLGDDGGEDGFCVDTPGFTILDLTGVPISQYAAHFREFSPYIGECKFRDCRHDTEDGCAVKAQVGESIHPVRYESYLSLIKT